MLNFGGENVWNHHLVEHLRGNGATMPNRFGFVSVNPIDRRYSGRKESLFGGRLVNK